MVLWFNRYTGHLKSERNNREFTVAITSARETMKPDYPGRYTAAVNCASPPPMARKRGREASPRASSR
jgi:hypothetical protein